MNRYVLYVVINYPDDSDQDLQYRFLTADVVAGRVKQIIDNPEPSSFVFTVTREGAKS